MFLDRLIARTLGETAALPPRRASRFEDGEGGFEERTEELRAEPAPRSAVAAAAPESPRRKIADPASIAEVPAPPAPVLPPGDAVRTGATNVREIVTVEPSARAMSPQGASDHIAAPRGTTILVEPSPPPGRVAPAPQPAAERPERPVRELRVEHHSIERRLETLVREQTFERSVEIRTVAAPAGTVKVARDKPMAASVAPARRAEPPPARVTSRRASPAPVVTPPPPPPAPSVTVTIGRVEVRAVQAPPARPVATPRTPRLGLDDYLKRREQR